MKLHENQHRHLTVVHQKRPHHHLNLIMKEEAPLEEATAPSANFYTAIASGNIEGLKVRNFLEQHGEMLSKCGFSERLKIEHLLPENVSSRCLPIWFGDPKVERDFELFMEKSLKHHPP